MIPETYKVLFAKPIMRSSEDARTNNHYQRRYKVTYAVM